MRDEIQTQTLQDYQEYIRILEGKVETNEAFVKCIHALSREDKGKQRVQDVLEILAQYYGAVTVLIMELDYVADRLKVIFDWNYIEEENFDGISLSIFQVVLDELREHGMFKKQATDQSLQDPYLNSVLKARNIENLMMIPLLLKEEIYGVIAVENMSAYEKEVELIQSIAYFITEDIRKWKMQSELEILSYTDALTGVYNRNKYMEELHYLERNIPETLGVVYADVNGLKQANDKYGHGYGDVLITKTARILKDHLGESIYRIGGDEFVALVMNETEEKFEEKVRLLRQNIEADGECNLSLGHVWRSGKMDIVKEISFTDELMYAEKQGYYKNMLTARVNNKSNAARELLLEIAHHKFDVHMQAKVELDTGMIRGAEALIRKKDGQGGFISPDEFIARYEADKIIRHVDFFVLETVCQMLQEWIRHGHPLKVSVNFSRITFMEYNITNEIQGICEKYQVNPKWIDIEITENSDKVDNAVLSRKLGELKQKGYSISLDDFGAKYSNIMMLSSMEFSEVKLDKSLIDHLCENKKNAVLIENTIKMVQDLNSTVSLAEGIETEEQRDMLKKLNCKYGQGYFFLKPLPIQEFLSVYLEQLS